MEDDIELLRLRAKAKLKLQEQEAQTQQEQPQEEPGMLEKASRVMNFESGLGRGALAGLVEPIVGKDIVTKEQVMSGTVPGSKELAEKAGVDLTYMYPGFVRNLAKLTGQEENLKSLAGGTVDVYTSPSTFLAPMARAAQIGAKGAKLGATKLLETLLNPIGVSLETAGKGTVAGAKGITKFGKAVAGKFSQFSPEEAAQYLQNPAAVKEATALLSDKRTLDVAQQKAFEAINKMRSTIKKAGISADKEMSEILEGKNIQANLNNLKELSEGMPAKKKAEYLGIIKKAEKDLEAYRPFEPEFGTTTARQQGVEGLTYPQTQPQMAPPSVTEVIPEQQSLFDISSTIKKEPEFLIPPKTVEKVEGQIIPGKPGYSEYFSPEAVKFSQMMQEPLPFPTRGVRPEAATIEAPEARRLKQILQEEATYGKSSPITAVGTPRYTEYADEANKLAQSLREIDKVKELDDYMRQGIVLQQALEKAESAPLQFLKTQSEDVTAGLARAARRTGDKEVFDLANQLSAARKIIGKGDYDDWVSRSGIRLAGRTALKAIDKFQKTGAATQDMINKVIKDPNVPPQIWMEMLRSKQEGQNK